jgi:F420-non-reducing hydrogenase iron-sulfur subunit
MRLNYPANIKILRVPCTGKVDVIHMLRAFEKGADGVYLVGCMEGNCAFEHGNFRAKKRVAKVASILDKVGIGGGRVRMYNLSSGDAPLFAQYAREMTENILALGPSPVRVAGAGQGAAAANAA